MSMLGKEVIYRGATNSDYGCTEPTALIKGKTYKVIGQNVRDSQTGLQLDGVEGEYNSEWFNEATPKKVFFGIAIEYHNADWYVGKRVIIKKFDSEKRHDEIVTTSPVISVEHIYGNIYKFETQNSVYITEVKTRTVV